MPSAASLDAAADVAHNNAMRVFRHATVTLRSQLIQYIDAIKAALPNPTEGQRTVTNWTKIMSEILQRLPTSTSAESLAHVHEVGTVVYRSARAMELAVSQGRLTAGQGTTLLAIYNAAWFPA